MCFCHFYNTGFQKSYLLPNSRFHFDESVFSLTMYLSSSNSKTLKTPCVRFSADTSGTIKSGNVRDLQRCRQGIGNHKRELSTLESVTVESCYHPLGWRRELLSEHRGRKGNVEMSVRQELWHLINLSSLWQLSRETARGINIPIPTYWLKLIEVQGQGNITGWEK